MAKEFDIDPRNKLGGEIEWETGDDFSAFIDALNRGAVVRGAGLPGMAESADDISLDEIALAELKSKLAQYR
jgi:hypothetical protein